MHECLAEFLQLNVDAQLEVIAGNGLNIVGTVVVVTLNLSKCVANEDFATFLSAQETLVTLLYAQVTG